MEKLRTGAADFELLSPMPVKLESSSYSGPRCLPQPARTWEILGWASRLRLRVVARCGLLHPSSSWLELSSLLPYLKTHPAPTHRRLQERAAGCRRPPNDSVLGSCALSQVAAGFCAGELSSLAGGDVAGGDATN